MKYRHAYHAGNFADVHKHVTLLALIAALKRKDKGFLYLETHAGRGAYDLTGEEHESRRGIDRFLRAAHQLEELQHYAAAVAALRAQTGSAHAYPGSPLLAAGSLRSQDRAVFIEIDAAEARALERNLRLQSRVRIECDDGFARFRAYLPPPERRGCIFIDPPYEETARDFEHIGKCISEVLRRFATGVIAVWYPIKDERQIAAWRASLARSLKYEVLASELWLYPRDSSIALNGSGLLIVNPPFQLAERMRLWLPQLLTVLDVDRTGGWAVHALGGRAAKQS